MSQRRMLSRRLSLSTKFNKMSRDSQLAYLMQTPYLDDYGNYIADPEEIKAEVMPRNKMSTEEIEKSLKEMDKIGITRLYCVDKKMYQHYTSFDKFQSFRKDRARIHEYPEYNESLVVSGIPTTTNDNQRQPQVKLSKVKLSISKDKIKKKEYITLTGLKMSQDIRLATLLFSLIKQNNPTHKQPDIDNWADEVRKMREIDKRTEEQIEFLIRWCQSNDFWQANILSTKKLREKFDQLVAQAKRDINSNKIQIL